MPPTCVWFFLTYLLEFGIWFHFQLCVTGIPTRLSSPEEDKTILRLRSLKNLTAELLPTPTDRVGVGRTFESVCLFVCLFVCLSGATQKRMIPKCSNLV